MNIWSRLMANWSFIVFRERCAEITPKIRALRVLEEAIELAQSEGVTEDEVNIIRNQVFSKPPGVPYQELGGVLTTLAGYSHTSEYLLEEVFLSEFGRIMDPQIILKVRHRNLEGDKIGFEKK